MMTPTPTLHVYDTGEELRDATPAEHAASIEAARHDGGAGVIEVDGVRCYVEGPAPLVSWRELRVWSLDGSRLGEADTRDALAEYCRTGAMHAWLADPAEYGPDGEPLSGEGPELHEAGPSRDEIDWSGFAGVVRDGRVVLGCECGAVSGDRHDYDLEESDDVVILEWMPPQHRAAHEAAGNSGAYPHNGAIRLVTLRGCAEAIVADEGDERWARIVEGEGEL